MVLGYVISSQSLLLQGVLRNGVRSVNVLGRRGIPFLRKLTQYLFESGTGHAQSKGQTSGAVVAVITTELFIPPWKLAKRWGGGSRENEMHPPNQPD